VVSPSSISSSEAIASPRKRARLQADRRPYGLFAAVGLLLALELVLRILNPDGILAGATDDERAYRGVVPELLAFGAPDVAIVGSSRARRGVNSPELQAALGTRKKPTRVANFALDGARAEETEITIRRIVEVAKRPRLIVWPISPYDLGGIRRTPGDTVRFLWRPVDWLRVRRKVGSDADRHLPDSIRNEVSRYSWLVRYRPIVRDLIEGSQRRPQLRFLSELIRGDRDPTPLHGATFPKHLQGGGSASRDVSLERVRSYLGGAFTERGWPRNHQAINLENAAKTLKRERIPLLFVELPSHPLLEEAMPPGTSKKFRQLVTEVAARHGTKFVTLADLGVEFEPSDFYEQSHVNYAGAKKYTKAITPAVVKALRRER
jgi:hypothetical protein